MRVLISFIGSALLLVIAPGAYSQDTLTLQPDATEGKDAFVNSHSTNDDSNFGTHSTLRATRWTAGSAYNERSFIEFDLSSIPQNAIIIEADLYLYGNSFSQLASGSTAAYIRRVTQSWSESTVTWNNQPTSTSTDQISIPEKTSTSDDTVNVVTHVEYFVNTACNNYGWMLLLQDESTLYAKRHYYSSDYGTASKRPKLRVIYCLPMELDAFTVSHASYLQDDGSIDVTITEGVGPYTYSWTGPNSFTSTSEDISSLEGGVYYLTVTDDVGNKFYDYFIVGKAGEVNTVTIQPDGDFGIETVTTATGVSQVGGCSPDGENTYLEASTNRTGSFPVFIRTYKRSLLKFNINGISSSDSIHSATFDLYGIGHVNKSGPTNESVFYRNTSDWDERTMVWDSLPSYTNTDSVLFGPSTGDNQDFNLDFTDHYTYFKNNPGNNHGFTFKLTDESTNSNGYNGMRFKSSDYGDSEDPKFTLQFTLGLSVDDSVTPPTNIRKGSIELTMNGGVAPYKVDWMDNEFPTFSNYQDSLESLPDTIQTILNVSTFDQDDYDSLILAYSELSIDSLTVGHYNVTVTDAQGEEYSKSFEVFASLEYEKQSNVTVTSTRITKSGTTGWTDHECTTENGIHYGEYGEFKYTLSSTSATCATGFKNASDENGDSGYDEMKSAIYIESGSIKVWQHDSLKSTAYSYSTNDTLKMFVQSLYTGVTDSNTTGYSVELKYFLNSTLFHHDTIEHKNGLLLDIAMYTASLQLDDLVINMPQKGARIHGEVYHLPCSSTESGCIDLSVTGINTTSAFTYSWNGPPGTGFATTQDVCDLVPGTYTVYVTDQNSVSTSRTFEVQLKSSWLEKTNINTLPPDYITLQKDASAGVSWNADAVSTNYLTGTCTASHYVSFGSSLNSNSISPFNSLYKIGFSDAASSQDPLYYVMVLGTGGSISPFGSSAPQTPSNVLLGVSPFSLVITRKYVLVDYTGASVNTAILGYGNGNDLLKFEWDCASDELNFYKNGALISTYSNGVADPTADVHLKGEIWKPTFEIQDIYTDLPCDPNVVYHPVKARVNNNFYPTVDSKLYVKYREDYISGNLTFNVYDSQNQVVVDDGDITVSKHYGMNWLEIDLSTQGLMTDNFYTLEIINDKQVKEILRFIYQ